jgi:hypothetical protein
MSNTFSYLKRYEELAPYFEAVQKIKNGEYVQDLKEIQKSCIKENHQSLHDGDKGIEHLPDAQVFFELVLEQNEANRRQESNSESSQQRKKSLERVFD